jgi:hypothetical protein
MPVVGQSVHTCHAQIARRANLPQAARLSVPPNQRQISRRPASIRGAYASSRTLGAGCDGRFGDARRAALTRTAKSCGPDAPTLASSFAGSDSREATVAKEPGRRGEHEISCKTIAQGRPGVSGEPVVTCSCAFLFRTRGCGCIAHPAFPAPSVIRGPLFRHSSGASASRERGSLCIGPPGGDLGTTNFRVTAARRRSR